LSITKQDWAKLNKTTLHSVSVKTEEAECECGTFQWRGPTNIFVFL
jgi:hypothetical protein